MDLVQQAGTYAGVAAFLGLAFLLPLYMSQSRDIRRLREWSERDPDAVEEAERATVASARAAQQAAVARATGAAEVARAEVRAAAELARTPAERVSAERPALSPRASQPTT